ncbi:response regulator [Spirosoma pomorum]
MTTTNLIYVVDDQADYRFLLQQLFRHYLPAYSVSLFDGGQPLLDKLSCSKPKPNLILLDRHMPGLDRHQTLLALKTDSLYKLIPVVMMSSEASAREINGCYEAGVNSFLRKQIDFPTMAEKINLICRYWFEESVLPTED